MGDKGDKERGMGTPKPRKGSTWHRTARHVAVLAAILVGSIVIALLAPRASFLKGLEEWSRDLRIALFTPPEPQDDTVVLVGVTDEVLDRLTYRFPVDRSLLAGIIRKLDHAGARAVGIDFLLDSTTEPEKDADLKRAMAEAHLPVVPIWADKDVGTVGERAKILKSFVGDLPTGYGMLERDRFDGTVRFHFPLWAPDKKVQWEFPAAIAHAVGVEPPALTRQRIVWHGSPPVDKGDKYIPPFRMYPADTVQFLPDEWFKDKVVLIGPVLVDIDIHRTPFSAAGWIKDLARLRSGVEIHAHILSQILKGRTQAMLSFGWEVFYVVLMAVIAMAFALMRLPVVLTLATTVALIAALAGTAFYVFSLGGPMMPLLSPILGFVIAATVTIVYAGRRERTQRLLVRWAFAHYVPESLVKKLDRDPSRLELGGERREITLIFSDLEGFTTLSEDMEPTLLSDIVNGYLEGIGATILKHGGTIDKFLGDGSMSFFGAPESAEDDAARAVACAIDMVAFSETFRIQTREQGVPLGRTRIGMHTGHAIVGNFGGRNRFDYTALGDVVNTAARLEAANKQIGTSILVSQETVDRALAHDSTRVGFLPVGNIVLFGKQNALMVCTPIPPDDKDAAFHARYCAAYEMLARNDPEAEKAFAALSEERPRDVLVHFHLKRLRDGQTGMQIVLEKK